MDANPRGAPSSRGVVAAAAIAVLSGVAELPFASFIADDLLQLGVLAGLPIS